MFVFTISESALYTVGVISIVVIFLSLSLCVLVNVYFKNRRYSPVKTVSFNFESDSESNA